MIVGPLLRWLGWYKVTQKKNRPVTGPRKMARDSAGSERSGEMSGNTFLLMVILIMILLFCLISLGPLIFF